MWWVICVLVLANIFTLLAVYSAHDRARDIEGILKNYKSWAFIKKELDRKQDKQRMYIGGKHEFGHDYD